MDTQRLILLVIFSFSLLMLWEAWEKEKRPKPPPTAPTEQPGVPAPAKPAPPAAKPSVAVPGAEAAKGEVIRVSTDLVVAEIDTLGGTLKRVELVRHKDSKDLSKNLVLLGSERQYEAQSGLAGEGGPNHRTLWRVEPGQRDLAPGRDEVAVQLVAAGKDGLEVRKSYTFKRSSYVVNVVLDVRNPGAAVAAYAYFQLTHDGKPETNTTTVAETFG